MNRPLRIIIAIVLLLVAAVIAIPFLADANQFRPLLESKLSGALGRNVKVGDLKLSVWRGRVTAGDLSIGDDPAFGAEPFLKAQSLAISVEVKPLIFERKLNVTAVSVDKPEVRIVMSEKGAWNFSSLGGSKPTDAPAAGGRSMDLAAQLVKIADGHIIVIRPGTKAQDFRDIDVELKNLSATSAVDFLLTAKRSGGGDLKIEGKAGPFGSTSGLPPLDAKISVPSLDLSGSGLVDASTGVEGIGALNGSIKTKGNAIEMSADVRIEKWKVVPKGSRATKPVEVTLAVSHDVATRSGALRRADVRIGKAAMEMEGSYSLAASVPTFALKFRGDKMPLTELASALPALDVVLPAGASIETGTLTLNTSVTGSLARFSAIGPLSLDNVKLGNFDLGAKLRVIETLAGIPANSATEIQTLRATLKRTPDGTAIENLAMIVPSIGELTGDGTISTSNDLNFNMHALVHTSGALMQAVGQKGDTRIPFLITGTTSNPIFKPNVKELAKEKVEQLTRDPSKTINAAKDIFNMFRKPKSGEQPQQ